MFTVTATRARSAHFVVLMLILLIAAIAIGVGWMVRRARMNRPPKFFEEYEKQRGAP